MILEYIFFKKSTSTNTALKKVVKVSGLTVLNFKDYERAMIIKTAWYGQKNRHISIE